MSKEIMKRMLAALMTIVMVISLLPALTLPVRAGLTTVYVHAATGNDTTGDGTASNPYQTFSKGYSMTPPGGTLDLTGTFTWTDVGEAGDAPITGFTINKDLTIQGHGAGVTVIQAAVSSGGNVSRVFTVSNGSLGAVPLNITLNQLEIRYGWLDVSNDGGALKIEYATVTINSSYMHHNKARQGFAIESGNSYLIINSSTISENSYNPVCSGYAGGAIDAQQSAPFGVTITNSTVYGNTGAQYGGGLSGTYGIYHVTNCTFANNACYLEGAGISIGGNIGGPYGTIYIKNTIVANNSSTTKLSEADYDDKYGGLTVDNGQNIIEFHNSPTLTGPGTLTGEQMSLNLSGSLAANGTINGVPTLALNAGSLAINTGGPGMNDTIDVLLTDQRGFGRNANVDIGAFEYEGIPPIPTVSAISPSGGSTAGGTSVAITGTNFTSDAAVSFGGVPAAVTYHSATSLTAVSPAHAAGAVDLTVITPGGTSAVKQFTYAVPLPTVALSVDSGTIAENGGAATVTATLSAESASDVTVTLGYSGTAVGGGTDYTASSAAISIPAGSTAGTVTVTAVNDTIDETDESIIVDIASVTNGVENGTQKVTVTIADDDAEPAISVNDPSVAEGNSGNTELTFTVILSAASGKSITIDYATANGTATAGSDYTAAGGALTFNAGETSKTVNVTVAGDWVTEPNETVLLNLSNPDNASIADAQGSGTITNDEADPLITVNDVSVAEGNADTSTLSFTVSLNHSSALTVTADYTAADNTATAGTDYAAAGGTLSFAPGETSKTISVTISGDVGYEPNESFYINLSNPTNATISDNQGIGTITNDDAEPMVTLSVDSGTIAEDGGATATATLSAVSSSEVTVWLAYSGTATHGGTDYTAASETITIPAGSSAGTVTVTAVNDTIDETDESIIVDIASVTNGVENGTQKVTVTIADDDAEPAISVNDTSEAEGNTGTSTLTFTVTLSAVSGKTITVDYATADGTAEIGTDYTQASGTLTFNPGETSKTLSVTVAGDTDQETAETLFLNLTNPVHASLADAQGRGDLLDDDTPVYTDSGTDAGAEVIVNGVPQNAGTAETTVNSDGQTVLTVTVDTDKLAQILASEGVGATVVIPIRGGADVAAGTLTGDMLKDMEDQDATLVIQTETGTYTVPASAMDLDAAFQQLGADISPSEIRVTVSISEPAASMTQVVEYAAQDGGFTIMVPAVDYTITCTCGDKTVAVSGFNSYVERTIAIPEGVDPTRITTGVVIDPDGTVYHVPTRIIIIDSKPYTVICSLTNSTYSVIWNPVEFSDVSNHWAKDAINDMGARMVATGVGNNMYDPDSDITRAEFAAVMVRALGLSPGSGESGFDDVEPDFWYCGYIKTAASYGIIKGYDNGSFGPNDSITREQAMTITARAMTITKLNTSMTENEADALLSAFEDGASASSFAINSIAACLKTGIIMGTTSVRLSPKDSVTRAEVAVMIRRLLEKSGLI
jgi:disulfide oxidoreductase YuzD